MTGKGRRKWGGRMKEGNQEKEGRGGRQGDEGETARHVKEGSMEGRKEVKETKGEVRGVYMRCLSIQGDIQSSASRPPPTESYFHFRAVLMLCAERGGREGDGGKM